MDYFRRFTFLFATPAFDANDLEGVRFNQIISEIEPFRLRGRQGAQARRRGDRDKDQRGDRMHDGRLGQKRPGRQDRCAH